MAAATSVDLGEWIHAARRCHPGDGRWEDGWHWILTHCLTEPVVEALRAARRSWSRNAPPFRFTGVLHDVTIDVSGTPGVDEAAEVERAWMVE